MSSCSKREFGPPLPKDQWTGAPTNPGIPFSNNLWMAPPPQTTNAPNAYGALSGHGVPSTIPPGGFLNFLQNGMLESTHNSKTHCDASSSQVKHGTDSGDVCWTEKRLSWTADEDVRLASAWLNNSNDPINGNSKRNEKYWCDVHAVYDSTTPTNRKRTVKNLKDRYQKIKRLVGFYCASWNKANSIYTSGQSDLQLICLLGLKNCWWSQELVFY